MRHHRPPLAPSPSRLPCRISSVGADLHRPCAAVVGHHAATILVMGIKQESRDSPVCPNLDTPCAVLPRRSSLSLSVAPPPASYLVPRRWLGTFPQRTPPVGSSLQQLPYFLGRSNLDRPCASAVSDSLATPLVKGEPEIRRCVYLTTPCAPLPRSVAPSLRLSVASSLRLPLAPSLPLRSPAFRLLTSWLPAWIVPRGWLDRPHR